MTRFAATEAGDRAALVAEAVVAHRERASERALFEAETGGAEPIQIVYADRTLTLSPDENGGRERADELLAEFPVFKVAQPATRKADVGVLHVSAIADPKHVADFVEAAFREVHGLPADYRLWVVEV